jgi:hypothetical protein
MATSSAVEYARLRQAGIEPLKPESLARARTGTERPWEGIKITALETQQYGQRRVIKDLFHIFADAAVSRGSPKNLGIFPIDYQEQLTVAGEEHERLRPISDFIASMTEQQAFVMHRRLTGVAPGSVTDIL